MALCVRNGVMYWWTTATNCSYSVVIMKWYHTRYSQPMRTWWRHQMEIFSALLAICAENSPVSGEFPAQRPVTPNFDVSFDLRLNKRLGKQSWGWWFETLSRPLWRHRNVSMYLQCKQVINTVVSIINIIYIQNSINKFRLDSYHHWSR